MFDKERFSLRPKCWGLQAFIHCKLHDIYNALGLLDTDGSLEQRYGLIDL